MSASEFKTPFLKSFSTFANQRFLTVHQSLLHNSEIPGIISLADFQMRNEYVNFSYEEVEKFCSSLIDKFISEGIREGNYVPLLTENPFDTIIYLLALWKIGAVPVVVNHHLTEKQLEGQLSLVEAPHLICQKAIVKKLPLLSKLISASKANMKQSKQKKQIDEAVVLFTSGTTANPKEVVLTFRNLFSAFHSGREIFRYNENDSWYLNLPLYHIGGFSLIARSLLAGSALILPESTELQILTAQMHNLRPTLISLVPTQLKRLVDNHVSPNPELRAVLIGGGFANDEILLKAFKLGWEIYKVYGSTETSAFFTALLPSELKKKTASVGKAFSSVLVKIVDEEKREMTAGQTGEIIVKSDAVIKNYLHNTMATEKVFHKDHYCTGDFGYLDADGYLFLKNRRTDLIVTGGENVSPIEIENEILNYPGIDEVCVIGIPDNEWGEKICVVYSAGLGSSVDEDNLKAYLKQRLPGFKTPKLFIRVEEFPKTALGKINRAELKSMFSKD